MDKVKLQQDLTEIKGTLEQLRSIVLGIKEDCYINIISKDYSNLVNTKCCIILDIKELKETHSATACSIDNHERTGTEEKILTTTSKV